MSKKARWMLGIFFGVLLGLIYGVMTQWINTIFLPGVPLYPSTSGRIGTVLLAMLGGGVLGFLATWPDEFLVGVIISSVVGTLFSSLASLLAESGDSQRLFSATVVLFITFLPRIFIFFPITYLIRWVVNAWEKETLYASYSIKSRLRSAILLVVMAIVVGVFSLYPAETRRSMKNLNELILAGRQAFSLTTLPQPLQKVNNFQKYANSPYTLKLLSNMETIPITRATLGFSQDEVDIEVTFTNGFRFGCVYTPPVTQPNCIDY